MGVLRKPLFISHWPETEPKIILEPTWWLGGWAWRLVLPVRASHQEHLPSGDWSFPSYTSDTEWGRGNLYGEMREFSVKKKQLNLEAGEAISSWPLAEADPMWPAVQSTTLSAVLLEHTHPHCSLVCIPWSVRMLLAASNRQDSYCLK